MKLKSSTHHLQLRRMIYTRIHTYRTAMKHEKTDPKDTMEIKTEACNQIRTRHDEQQEDVAASSDGWYIMSTTRQHDCALAESLTHFCTACYDGDPHHQSDQTGAAAMSIQGQDAESFTGVLAECPTENIYPILRSFFLLLIFCWSTATFLFSPSKSPENHHISKPLD